MTSTGRCRRRTVLDGCLDWRLGALIRQKLGETGLLQLAATDAIRTVQTSKRECQLDARVNKVATIRYLQ